MSEGSGFAKLVAANKEVLSKPGCAEKAGVGGASNFWEHKVRNYKFILSLFLFIFFF